MLLTTVQTQEAPHGHSFNYIWTTLEDLQLNKPWGKWVFNPIQNLLNHPSSSGCSSLFACSYFSSFHFCPTARRAQLSVQTVDWILSDRSNEPLINSGSEVCDFSHNPPPEGGAGALVSVWYQPVLSTRWSLSSLGSKGRDRPSHIWKFCPLRIIKASVW